jgi:hypothetical protein
MTLNGFLKRPQLPQFRLLLVRIGVPPYFAEFCLQIGIFYSADPDLNRGLPLLGITQQCGFPTAGPGDPIGLGGNRGGH